MSAPISHWHILGAGSIGSLWGAHLALSGCEVTLLLRNAETAASLRQQGGLLLIDGEDQRMVPVSGEPVGASGLPCKKVLVATKAHQTLDALEGIRGRIDSRTCLLLMQNGMGMSECVTKAYPEATLLLGTTTEGAWRPERFRVKHEGHGTTWLGPGHSSIDATTRDRIVSDFAGAALAASWEADITMRLWHKLAINCAINPLTALLGCRNGALAQGGRCRHLLAAVCREIDHVLAAEGIALGRTAMDMAIEVARATAMNRSSMLEDLRAGRSTEIDWINGFLVARAGAHDIQVPLNGMLVDLVHAAESLRDKTDGSG